MIVLNLYFDANKVGRARWSDLTNKCQLCNFYEIIPGKYIMQYYGGGRDGGEVKKKKWRFRGEEWKRGKETRRKLQEKLSKCTIYTPRFSCNTNFVMFLNNSSILLVWNLMDIEYTIFNLYSMLVINFSALSGNSLSGVI